VGRPTTTVNFLLLFKKFPSGFDSEMVKRWSSDAQKFSYKIWMCRELNNEQLSPLMFFSKFHLDLIEFDLKIIETI
jgi:hypothetical protein